MTAVHDVAGPVARGSRRVHGLLSSARVVRATKPCTRQLPVHSALDADR